MAEQAHPTDWPAYYRVSQGRRPRPLFVAMLDRMRADGLDPAAGQAVDLGCGDGTETLALLREGWQALAIDATSDAIARVRAAVPAEHRPRLRTQVASFETMTLPPADVIYAGLSLPFRDRRHFPAMWGEVAAAIRPGGRFAGHFFGERDMWAESRPSMTFQTRDELVELLGGFKIEFLDESEHDRPTALGEPKHWHIFEVIARRCEDVTPSWM